MEILIRKSEYKNLELMEGDTYVIHKPADVNESPSWISSMDRFDGMTIELTRQNGETSTRRYWLAKPIDDDVDDTICSFNMNWLEPIYHNEDLCSYDVDFFSI